MDDADENLIDGTGSAADYAAVAGDTYAANQDPFTAADNGTVTTSNAGSGTAASTVAAPANGASVSSPSWLSSLTSGFTSAATAASNGYTSIAPIINGQPATSPAKAGQTPAPGTSTIATAASNPIVWIIGGLVALGAAFLLFKGRK